MLSAPQEGEPDVPPVENYAIRSDVLWVGDASGIFALNAEVTDPRPHLISGGGALIWQLIAEQTLTVEALAKISGAEPDDIREATAAFIDDATRLGLLVPLNST